MVTYMTLYIKLDIHRPNGYVAMIIAVQARNTWKVATLFKLWLLFRNNVKSYSARVR